MGVFIFLVILTVNGHASSLAVEGESAFSSTTGCGGTVKHCLTGTWQDGPRTVEITQTFNQVIAVIVSGTIVCGETGQTFSGTLDGDTITGTDLKVCNDAECVKAGLQEKVTYTSFTGTVSADDMSIDIQWVRLLVHYGYDKNGNLISCTYQGSETAQFTMTMVTPPPSTTTTTTTTSTITSTSSINSTDTTTSIITSQTSTTTVAARITVDFTGSPTSRTRAPLKVTFQNLSTGDIAGYLWYLGDGSKQAPRKILHIPIKEQEVIVLP